VQSIGLVRTYGQDRVVQPQVIQKEEEVNIKTMATPMKKVIKKAAKFESKKSLNGAMKFLKGNVNMPVKKKK